MRSRGALMCQRGWMAATGPCSRQPPAMVQCRCLAWCSVLGSISELLLLFIYFIVYVFRLCVCVFVCMCVVCIRLCTVPIVPRHECAGNYFWSFWSWQTWQTHMVEESWGD